MPEPKRLLKVFLCHASADRFAVRSLYKRLTLDGVDAWLDRERLLPGQDWRVEIPRAIRDSDVIIICLSKNSINQEGYVHQEIKLALDIADEKPNGSIFIIPARMEECEVPDKLGRYHWVDLFEEDGYKMLIRSLGVRANKIGATLGTDRSWLPTYNIEKKSSLPIEKRVTDAQVRAEELTKEARERAESLAKEVRKRGESAVEAVRKPKKPEDESPAKENKSSSSLDVSGNVSGSVVVAGSNNVIHMGTRTRGFLIPNNKDLEKAKPHVLEERVLEAAIEKPVYVGKSASLFVWIKRHGSKNILFAVSAIDENVILDENNVKAKSLEIEFPVENGEAVSAGITLKLVAYEFEPSIQQKKIKVPPKGDSEVCTFIVTPKQAGELRLNLEVLKDKVTIGNRTLITTAIETEKKVGTSLVLVTIPIVVFVHTDLPATESESKNELIEAERYAREEVVQEIRKRVSSEKAEREIIERESAEKLAREIMERAQQKREMEQESIKWMAPEKAYMLEDQEYSTAKKSVSLPKSRSATKLGAVFLWIVVLLVILLVIFCGLWWIGTSFIN